MPSQTTSRGVIAVASFLVVIIGSSACSPDTPKKQIIPYKSISLAYQPPEPVLAPLPARTWLLSQLQYQKSVRSIFGFEVDASLLGPEVDGGTFINYSDIGLIRVDLARKYESLSETIANQLTNAQLQPLTVPCGTLTPPCKAVFVNAVLSRAFRRPATADEMADYGGLFDLVPQSADATLPFRFVIQGVLSSPNFLYRTEIGAPEDGGKMNFSLTGREVASLLAYSLLGTTPSNELLAAADRGELTDPVSLKTAIKSLLDSPAAEQQFKDFLGQWLSISRFKDVVKFEDSFSGFESVRTSIQAEADTFISEQGTLSGTLSGLLTTPFPPAEGILGVFYGSTSDGQPYTRSGIFGLGAFLAINAHPNLSSPTSRGLFVRERLLCQKLPPPPGSTDLTPAEQRSPPKTTRELYELHKTETSCAGCHIMMDDVGFAFENFDGAGRFRTTELFRNQTVPAPIDSTGFLNQTDVNRPLANPSDLAQALVQSDWVRECAAIHGFRYYFGYGADVARGLPSVIAGYQALALEGRFQDFVLAILSSPTTWVRSRQ